MPVSLYKRIKQAIRQRIRIVIFISTWLQLGSVLNCVDVFSFAMVYMGDAETMANSTAKPETYTYTMEQKSSLISAMAIGSLIGMYPQNKLMQAYGARPVLTISGLLCAIITSLLPWALDTHYNLALVFRILQGIMYSADFGVVGYVCAKWAPLNEVGLSIAALSGFTACRAVIQLPLAGWAVSRYGWRSIYYILSVILFFITFMWYFIYRDFPEDYHSITNTELEKIKRGKKKESHKASIPYKKILFDKHVWAVWIAGAADIFASFVFLVFGAQYYHYLGLNIQANAWLNSMKGLLFLLVRFMVGLASDRIMSLSEKTKLRLFNTIALQAPAVFLVILGLLPRERPYLHIICITFFQALFGFNCGGFYKGGALISRHLSHVVIGQVQLFKSLAILIEPILFSFLISSGENSWTGYFLVHAVVLTIANTIFLFLASGDPSSYVIQATEEPKCTYFKADEEAKT